MIRNLAEHPAISPLYVRGEVAHTRHSALGPYPSGPERVMLLRDCRACGRPRLMLARQYGWCSECLSVGADGGVVSTK